MSRLDSRPSLAKKISFTLVILVSFILILILSIAIYFAYKKMSLSYDYCQSFGEIDSEVGWVLKKNVVSCLTLKNRLADEVYFDTTIYTDSNGFRTHKNGINLSSSYLAIGDSWTFGYGVNGNETYPYYLSQLLDEPVHNAGVPAYGSASTYVSAISNIEKLHPKTVIFFTLGLYKRSICNKPWGDYTEYDYDESFEGGKRPREPWGSQLIPCYLINPSNFKTELIIPAPGVVERSAKNNVFPGGALTAGYDSFWEYVFITRPKLALQSLKEIFNPIHPPTYLEDFHIKKFDLKLFLDLAERFDFDFVMIDPTNDYKQVITSPDFKKSDRFIYIDKNDWDLYMNHKLENMTHKEIYIPMDGHYSKKMNKLIAEFVYQHLAEKYNSHQI